MNKEEKRKYNEAWRAAHPDYAKTKSKEWQAKHVDEIKIYSKEYYIANAEQLRNKQSTFVKARYEFRDKLKSVPCMDCQQTYPPECMDFDHLPGEVKLFSIGQRIKNKTMEVILAEVAKCDIVCANCHRIRTKDRILNRSVI